ncbi:TPA: hypothetical protein ACPDKP_000778 [Pasteurella multocida]
MNTQKVGGQCDKETKKDIGDVVVPFVYHAVKSVSFWVLTVLIVFTTPLLHDVIETYESGLRESNSKITFDGLCIENFVDGDGYFRRIPSNKLAVPSKIESCTVYDHVMDKPRIEEILKLMDSNVDGLELAEQIKSRFSLYENIVRAVLIILAMFVGPRLDRYIKDRIPRD